MEHFFIVSATLIAFATGMLCKRVLKRRRYFSHVQSKYLPVLDTAALARLEFDIPPIADFQRDITAREETIIRLSTSINIQLQRLYESNQKMGREHLAHALVEFVEHMVLDHLNSSEYSFDRIDYGGDINYENSEQTYFNGTTKNPGLLLEFRGFSCNVSWSRGILTAR